MAGKLSDLLSRSKAAKGMSKSMPPPEEEMPMEEPPMEMPPEEALGAGGGEELPPELAGGEAPPMAPEEAGPADIDMALANVEASLADLDPAVQEEVRTHLNAIRDLVGGAGAPEEEAPPASPEDPQSLMVPPTAKSSEVQM